MSKKKGISRKIKPFLDTQVGEHFFLLDNLIFT